MDNQTSIEVEKGEEMPDERWHKVYAAVVFTTAVVILALWFFSRHFSR